MQYNRNTFQLTQKLRKRQLYHQKWKQFNSNDHPNIMYKSNGGYAILWELERVDRQIQTLQSEISVLKQQLKIVQTGCVPPSLPPPPPPSSTIDKPNNSSDYLPGYFFCFFFLTLFFPKIIFYHIFKRIFYSNKNQSISFFLHKAIHLKQTKFQHTKCKMWIYSVPGCAIAMNLQS